MKISRVWAVYFSPCGNTKKITIAIADYVRKKIKVPLEFLDYTLPDARIESYTFTNSDLVIWGSPVYTGRIPNLLLPFVKNNFIGNEALGVPVVVFGNRSFDYALVELRNELNNNGLRIIAGAGFVAQHAFSNLISKGRPDFADMNQVDIFSQKLVDKIDTAMDIRKPGSFKGYNSPIAYYKPKGIHGENTDFLKAKPKTDITKCILCGICVNNCPMGIIHQENPVVVNGNCIKCHACINLCQRKAKYFDDMAFQSHKLMLEKSYTRRSEPETFI